MGTSTPVVSTCHIDMYIYLDRTFSVKIIMLEYLLTNVWQMRISVLKPSGGKMLISHHVLSLTHNGHSKLSDISP